MAFRIVKKYTRLRTWYEVQQRFLFLFWTTVGDTDIDPLGMVYGWYPREFDDVESARKYIQLFENPTKTIIHG